MREVLLPTKGYPHLVGVWMRFYERFQKEVDRLQIHFNENTHGVALKKMVEEAKGDYLLLMEDDGLIIRPDIVNKYFSILEGGEYDVIGSPRMSCSPEIADKAKEFWSLNYEGLGDKGPSFWPNMFFVRRDLLLKTDMNFANRGWSKGETVKLPNHEWVVESDEIAGDTFVWMSLQLRSLGARVLEIPQNHSSPYDLEHHEKKEGLWGERQIDYVHIGSMTGDFSMPNSEIEKLEAEKRIGYHQLCGDYSYEHYIDVYGLSIDRILEWKIIYEDLLGI